jgi:hypothetical protein
MLGEIVVWRDDTGSQITSAPATGGFVSVVPGGAKQCLAMRTDGTLLMWGVGAVQPLTFAPSDQFTEAAIGVSFVAAIDKATSRVRTSGKFAGPSPGTYGPDATPPAAIAALTCASVSVGGGMGVIIDGKGELHQWGASAGSEPHLAHLGFLVVRARNGYCVAISERHDLYGWGGPLFANPNTLFFPTPGGKHPLAGTDWKFANNVWFCKGPFTAIACGGHPSGNPSALQHVLALRPNGSVTGWGSDASGEISTAPKLPHVKLTQIAAGAGFSVGLDTGGMLHHWGAQWGVAASGSGPALPPPGPFMSIGAGVAHSSAVRFVV